MLGSYVKPMEWGRPSMDTLALGPNEARSIIDHWNPFNKRDSSTTHMRELYPTLLRIPMAALSKEYSISFPSYMNKKSYQRVAENMMFIRNLDFDETVELV